MLPFEFFIVVYVSILLLSQFFACYYALIGQAAQEFVQQKNNLHLILLTACTFIFCTACLAAWTWVGMSCQEDDNTMLMLTGLFGAWFRVRRMGKNPIEKIDEYERYTANLLEKYIGTPIDWIQNRIGV